MNAAPLADYELESLVRCLMDNNSDLDSVRRAGQKWENKNRPNGMLQVDREKAFATVKEKTEWIYGRKIV